MLEEINSKQLERYQKDQQKTNKNEQNLNKKPKKKRTLGTCPKIKQNRVPRRAIFTTTASTSWCFFFCRGSAETFGALGGPTGGSFFHRAFHMIKAIHSICPKQTGLKHTPLRGSLTALKPLKNDGIGKLVFHWPSYWG